MQTQDSSKAEQARNSTRDTLAHSSVQPWSAGEFFPAVIGRVERYREWADYAKAAKRAGEPYLTYDAYYLLDLEHRLESVSHVLMLDGVDEEYATHEDAEQAALYLIDPANIDDRLMRKAQGPEVQS